MNTWLTRFAFRTDMDYGVFLYSGMGLLIISLLGVMTQSFKAAIMNPVDTLKEE